MGPRYDLCDQTLAGPDLLHARLTCPLACEAPQAIQVLLLVGSCILALRLPQGFSKALDHFVLSRMEIAGSGRRSFVNGGDARRSIGRNLLADAQMQAHVQERVRLARRLAE